jgi:hypothetical protein
MKCLSCSAEAPEHCNYCDWGCHIDHAKALGGQVHLPNGLPINCIRADGTMLEHAHGDHPDYKFPVAAEFVPRESDLESWERRETHALIYTDGHIAVTLYECCYALWRGDGACIGGSMWKKGEWRLTDETMTKIKELNACRS